MPRPQANREMIVKILSRRMAGKSRRATSQETGIARNTVAKWGRDEIVQAIFSDEIVDILLARLKSRNDPRVIEPPPGK